MISKWDMTSVGNGYVSTPQTEKKEKYNKNAHWFCAKQCNELHQMLEEGHHSSSRTA